MSVARSPPLGHEGPRLRWRNDCRAEAEAAADVLSHVDYTRIAHALESRGEYEGVWVLDYTTGELWPGSARPETVQYYRDVLGRLGYAVSGDYPLRVSRAEAN